MSVESAHSNPSEVESKGSRDWMFMLPFCGVVAQLSQAAALGLASYRPRVKLCFSRTELCQRCQSAHALEFTGTGAESM